MHAIKPSCSYKLIVCPEHVQSQPLAALSMSTADDCEPCLDQDQLQASLDNNPESIIVYNQHTDALAPVDNLRVSSSQIYIEIRQDTKGVLGLDATRNRGHQPETLELIY